MVEGSPSSDQVSSLKRPSLKRRRFLQAAAAVGGVTLVAGCGGQPGPGAEGTPEGEGTPTEAGVETETEPAPGTETVTGTGTTTGVAAGAADVRVAHMSPNAPAVDIYVDGEAVLESVEFGTVSDYLEVSSGSHTVQIRSAAGAAMGTVTGTQTVTGTATPTGTATGTVTWTPGAGGQVLFEGDVTVEGGEEYTVVAIGEFGEGVDQPFQPLVLLDDNEEPPNDTALVRLVHAVPDAPPVDVVADGTVLVEGLAFGDAEYTEVPEGDYTLEVLAATGAGAGTVTGTVTGTTTPTGTPTGTVTGTAAAGGEPIATFDVSFDGGEVFTAFLAGYLTPEDEPADVPLELIVAQDTA